MGKAMESELTTLLFHVEEGIGVITLNRPDKLNALNRTLLEELGTLLDSIEKREEIKALVVTGSGDKAFAAGADIGELKDLDPMGGRETAQFGQGLCSRLENSKIPVVGAVNGFALGGGCELAMACHMRVASERAQFGQPEVALGLIPGYGGTQRLPRLVGRGVAIELLVTGDRIPADRAFQLGLVNQVVPHEELMAKAMDLAKRASKHGPLAVRYCIEAVNQGIQMPMEEALYLEATLFGLSCGSEDMTEGTSAFLEKRKPTFKGR
jgi:enoyl-CoA hydratase